MIMTLVLARSKRRFFEGGGIADADADVDDSDVNDVAVVGRINDSLSINPVPRQPLHLIILTTALPVPPVAAFFAFHFSFLLIFLDLTTPIPWHEGHGRFTLDSSVINPFLLLPL